MAVAVRLLGYWLPLQNEYILRYHLSSIGTAVSSTWLQRVMISAMSGWRKAASYERKILLTTPNTSLAALLCLSGGSGGENRPGLFCIRPAVEAGCEY